MKRLIQTIFVSILGFAAVTACYNDNKEDLYTNFTGNCDTAETSYSGFVKPLITANCTQASCHNSNDKAGGRDLTIYQQVKDVALSNNGILIGRVTGTGGPLMPQGGPKLPQCDIDRLQIWVDNGAPNN